MSKFLVGDKLPASEDDFLILLLGKSIGGTLENGARFGGQLVKIYDKYLLIEGQNGHQTLIKRKEIAQIFDVEGPR